MLCRNFHFSKLLIGVLIFILLVGCTSAPKLQSQLIRSWNTSLDSEYPQEKSIIAHYKRGPYELFYLAVRHTNTFGSDTLNLTNQLFSQFKFNALLIEPIPFSYGDSPKWFVQDAIQGRSDKFIKGGESSLAAILANQNNIPFFGGEPSHIDFYNGLKSRGYTDEDIIGFVLVRQIPQWVREQNEKKGLIDRNGPKFIENECRLFAISNCPKLHDIKAWYQTKLGHELVSEVSNEETAPINDGHLFTQKMSSEVGRIRDHFTLNLIETMLQKYKKIAVIYGAGHFITLRKSFDSEFGQPTFIEDK